MALTTTAFDVTDYLENEADMAEYLSEAVALEDPACFRHALGAVARARHGGDRQSFYKALGESGNPESSAVVKVLGAPGRRAARRSQGSDAVAPSDICALISVL